MPLDLNTAAVKEPVTLSQAKAHLRVDISDDDGYIGDLIQSVRTEYEDKHGVAFISQTWNLYLDAFVARKIKLPNWPLQSVTHIKYTPYGGAQTTFSSGSYNVDVYSKPGWILLDSRSSWPTDELVDINGIEIQFVAGWGDDPSDVPMPIRQAMLLAIGNLYENRETLIVGAKFANAPDLEIDRLLMMNYRSFNS